jgi:DAK2 domain fusion protein YloV
MTINGKTFYGMCVSAANALDNNKNEINNLNVFPVPDGDTGTNMSLTMDAIQDVSVQNGAVSDIAKSASNLIMRAARGNSGAILSLFFRGMAKGLEGLEVADSRDIAAAFENGTKEAYKAVQTPTEGTILTVMRIAAEEAVEACKTRFEGDVAGLLWYIVQSAENALAQTPEILPILKQANVVDAGGSGFVTMLRGMLAFLKDSPVTRIAPTETKESADFASFETGDIKFHYCTECIVDKPENAQKEGNATAFRDFLLTVGDSLVFVDEETFVKIHVHTNHPGSVMEEALKYGILTKVKVENMQMQHSSLVESTEQAPIAPVENKPYGFVAVCMGEGMRSVFTDLGVDNVVYGGQTMNPSTQDLIDAVAKTPADVVYILPNNKNIYMVSEQAAKIIDDKKVYVINSASVPQGISAMLAFDENASSEENFEAMQDATKTVTTLSMTHAVRDVELDGIEIHNGQVMALVDGKIKAVCESDDACMKEMQDLIAKADIITVFYGKDITEEQAKETEALLKTYNGSAELVLVNGGQPLYEYIFSLE